MSQRREDPAATGGRIGGPRGGEAALHGEKVNAAQIKLYLKGIDYPASKNELLETAKFNNAPQNVLTFLDKLPSRTYNRANEIEIEFGKLK